MKLNLGNNIRKYRKEKGMTQEGLAEYLGVSPQAVSRWESGVTYPDMELVPVFASLFGVSTDALFDMEESEKEKAATETIAELARLSTGEALRIESIKDRIRDIRQNYLGCDCFWNFWLSVKHKAYRHEAILPEVRLTFEAIMAGNYPIEKKLMAVSQFSLIEDEEHIEALLNEYSTVCDMSKTTLLYDRYLACGDFEKADRYRQDILFGHVDMVIGYGSMWQEREAPFDPVKTRASTEFRLDTLHRFCMCESDEKHPVSGNGEVDMWVATRIWLGIRGAAFSAHAGETEKAFLMLEDTVSLLEKTMKIEHEVLSSGSPWLEDFVCTAKRFWGKLGGLSLLETQKEKGIYFEYGRVYCDELYPSLYYTMMTERPSSLWYTKFNNCFDGIREDVRYLALTERVKALIEIREE